MTTEKPPYSDAPFDCAFPRPTNFGEAPQTGLTKREYFAAMAMQGMLAHSGGDSGQPREYSEDALDYADALIAALNGGNK